MEEAPSISIRRSRTSYAPARARRPAMDKLTEREALNEAKRRLRAQLIDHHDASVRTLVHTSELADNHRVQLSRRAGWRMPPNTVKVDRTTQWGNPFGDYPTREAQVARFRA